MNSRNHTPERFEASNGRACSICGKKNMICGVCLRCQRDCCCLFDQSQMDAYWYERFFDSVLKARGDAPTDEEITKIALKFYQRGTSPEMTADFVVKKGRKNEKK